MAEKYVWKGSAWELQTAPPDGVWDSSQFIQPSVESFWDGTQWVEVPFETMRLFKTKSSTAEILEVNAETFAVVRSWAAPGTYPSDVGGMNNRLYSSDSSSGVRYFEHNIDTMAVISTGNGYESVATGVGGMNDRLFGCNNRDYYEYVYEMWPDSLSSTSNRVQSMGYTPFSMGGTADKIFHTNIDSWLKYVYRLNPDTLAVTQSVEHPATGYIYGIGGTKDRLFACGRLYNYDYELNVSTLVPIRSVPCSYTTYGGIGGMKNK